MLQFVFLCALASVAKSYTLIRIPLGSFNGPPGHQLKLIHVALGGGPNTLSNPQQWHIPNITIRFHPAGVIGPMHLENDMKLAHKNGNLLQQRYAPFLKSYEQPLHPHLIELRNPHNFNVTQSHVLSALNAIKGKPFCTDLRIHAPSEDLLPPVKHSLINDITRVHNPDACPAFYKKFKNLFGTHDNIMSEFRDHLKNVMNRFPQFKDDPEKLGFLHDLSKYNDQNGALPTCKGEGEVIKTMSRKVYETAFSITSLKRLSAGRYVSHLLDDVDHLRTKGETPDGKKMVLFGTTPPFLKSIMSAMGGDEGYHSENLLPHPEAGSMFLTEVYQKVEEQTYHIRLHYSNNPSQPISDKNILKLRGCDELCEFDKFKNLMKPMYLSKDDADKECLE